MGKIIKRKQNIVKIENKPEDSIDNAVVKTEECKLEAESKRILSLAVDQKENSDIKQKPYKRLGKLKYSDKDIKNLITYIVDEGYTMSSAARTINMDRNSANRFYQRYLKEGKKIPEREGRRVPNSLCEEHKAFIAKLYKENQGLNLTKVHNAIATRFPELNITRSRILCFLRSQMPEEHKLTVRYKRKFFDHHVEYLQGIIDNDPKITTDTMYKNFNKEFPDASVTKNAFYSQLRRHFGGIYPSPHTINKPRHDKHYPDYMEFILKSMENDPKKSLMQATSELLEAFPGHHVSYSSIKARLKRDHYDFYKVHVYDRHYKPKEKKVRKLIAVRILTS